MILVMLIIYLTTVSANKSLMIDETLFEYDHIFVNIIK